MNVNFLNRFNDDSELKLIDWIGMLMRGWLNKVDHN